jgi:polysaccharide export outer membrane protein
VVEPSRRAGRAAVPARLPDVGEFSRNVSTLIDFAPRRRSALGLAALVLLAGCQPGRGLPPLPPPINTVYTLGPGDQVRVITFGEPTLTGTFTVEDSGAVAVPLLDAVPAEGLSTHELADRIADALLAKGLLREPSVSVQVAAFRPIFVLGEVSKPGQYAYQPGMTMLSAVAIAGGFTYRAVDGYASVVRHQHGNAVEGQVGRDALLAPGDVVTVFERNF